MNTVIWKYEISKNGISVVDIPNGAEVLTIQMQQENLCVWAAVGPLRLIVKRWFLVVFTGDPMPESVDWSYMSTVQYGPYVLHVFVLDEGGVV